MEEKEEKKAVGPAVVIGAAILLVAFLVFMGMRFLRPAPYTPSPGAGVAPAYPGGSPGAVRGSPYPGGGPSPQRGAPNPGGGR